MATHTYFKIVFAITFTVLTAAGCMVYSHVSSVTETNTDFTIYHSFAWLPDSTQKENLPYNNEIIRNNIRNYVGKSFVERGYFIDLDTPDVLLHVILMNTTKYTYVVKQRPPYYYCRYYYGSIYCTPYPVEYYYRHYGHYHYPFIYNEKKIAYIESSITLNVIDRKLNEVIWSATARGDVFDVSYINEHIHPAVEAIMRRYPVKPVQKKHNPRKKQTDDIYSSNQ